MKNMIIASALFASTAAFAGQNGIMAAQPGSFEGYTSVSCRDARNMADAGVMVAITQRGTVQYLDLSEQTFQGPRKLGTVPVRQMLDRSRGNHAAYVGQTVSLMIDMDSSRRADVRNGEMIGFIRGVVGQARLDHDLRCQFFYRAY